MLKLYKNNFGKKRLQYLVTSKTCSIRKCYL